MGTERWLPVIGFDGWYEVSDLGNVRSWHNNMWGRAKRPRALSQATHKDGRKAVFLKHPGDAKGVNFKVHVLVMEAFVGARPDGMEICHGDGDASNNTASNLRYDTHLSNCADTVNHERSPKGRKNGQNILSEDDVHEIVALWNSHQFTQPEIASRFGVKRATVNNIVHGYTWSWLTGIRHQPPPCMREDRTAA